MLWWTVSYTHLDVYKRQTYLYRIIFDRFRTCTEAVWLWIFLPPQWEDYEKEKHSAKQII